MKLMDETPPLWKVHLQSFIMQSLKTRGWLLSLIRFLFTQVSCCQLESRKLTSRNSRTLEERAAAAALVMFTITTLAAAQRKRQLETSCCMIYITQYNTQNRHPNALKGGKFKKRIFQSWKVWNPLLKSPTLSLRSEKAACWMWTCHDWAGKRTYF